MTHPQQQLIQKLADLIDECKSDRATDAWQAEAEAALAALSAGAVPQPPHWLLEKLRFALDAARRTISVDHPVRDHVEAAMADIAFFELMNHKQEEEAGAVPQPSQDGIRYDAETETYVARHTILTAGRTEDEARLALASAVKLTADAWPPRAGAVPQQEPQALRDELTACEAALAQTQQEFTRHMVEWNAMHDEVERLRAPQQEAQVTFTTTTVEGSSVAMCGTAEAYKHFYEKRGPEQELQAIRALCLDAGMHPDSTTLDYIRGAFYMLKAYVQKPAVPALPAPQEQDGK
jgi:hypothetical protein